MSRSVNVYAIIRDLCIPPDFLFYADAQPEEDDDLEEPSAGLTGWFQAWASRVKSRWRHSEGKLATSSRTLWSWLHARTHPDEVLLSRLRRAKSIELYYPAVLDESRVAQEWANYLAAGRRRHWPWLLVNLALAPASLLLAPLPGPNLIGYWFLYRSLHHLRILHGLGRLRRGEAPTHFHAEFLLNERIDGPTPPDFAAMGCDPHGVDLFLRKHGIARAPVTQSGAAS